MNISILIDKKTRYVFGVILVLVLFINLSSPILASEYVEIDPVSYLKLLDTILSLILDERYNDATALIKISLNTSIKDVSLSYEHIKLYNTLSRINTLLNMSLYLEIILSNMSSNEAKNYIRRLYNELYILKDEIRREIDQYVSRLSRYKHDKASFFIYKYSIDNKLKSLEIKIDNTLEQLEKIYRTIEENIRTGWIDISVEYPEKIYCGDTLDLRLKIVPVINGSKRYDRIFRSTLYILVNIGGYVEDMFNETIIIPTNASYTIKLPGAEQLVKRNILIEKAGSVYSVDLSIIVKASVLAENIVLRGYRVVNMKMYLVKPRIIFSIPSVIYLNRTFTVDVKAFIDHSLNVSIYADKVSNETLLTNTTIEPGESKITINNHNLSIGYHTIIIVSHPYGKYLSSKWSSALAVTYPSINVVLNIPKVVIGLTQTFIVEGYLKKKSTYNIIVSIDNRRVYEKTFNTSKFSIVVEPPFSLKSLIVWFRRVDIEIIPYNSSYAISKYSFNILFINPLFIASLILVTGIIYMHPTVSTFISSMFYGIRSYRIRRLQRRRHEKIIFDRGKEGFLYVKTRSFRLRRYYRLVISLLSDRIGRPRDYETLREYLSRIQNLLPVKISRILQDLFLLFELELYSKKRVSLERVKRLYKVLSRMLRHEA